MKKLYLLVFVILTVSVAYIFNLKLLTTDSNNAFTANNKESDNKILDRIVSICKHPIPYILLGLDGSDKRLVGIHPGTKKSMSTKVLNKYFPRFQSISDKICNQGFTPNIEEIVRLNPDVIFTWEMYPNTTKLMREFDLNVMPVKYDGSNQNDRNMIDLLANAVGREERADSIMRWRRGVLNGIKSITDTLSDEERPKVIFLYDYENLDVGGEKCYEHFCINIAGGRNLGDGLGIDRAVNIEQILAWDPDIMLYGGWADRISPIDIYQNSLLADVSAVKEKRIFKMPHWASNESPLIWEWMTQLFHPDKFDYDLRADIKSVYYWQYDIQLTEEEVGNVLFYQENAVSPHYTNFKP